MPEAPDTRDSLIQRLADARDVEAWDTFVEIYEPLIYRLARGRGFQHADAEDLVQEVLAAVAKSVEHWVDRDERGPFRAWLFRIACNLMVNFLTRPHHQRLGVGGSRVAKWLDEQCDPRGDESAFFLLEYRRELFRWAAERVRLTVTEKVWLAFWLTSVDERLITDVSQELNMTVGSIYIARSRITKKIRDLVQQQEELIP